MAKPIAARIVGKRASNAATSRTSGSSAPRKSKASGGPIDDMQYTAQAAKICAGIQVCMPPIYAHLSVRIATAFMQSAIYLGGSWKDHRVSSWLLFSGFLCLLFLL
jgi:hypothetical protein